MKKRISFFILLIFFFLVSTNKKIFANNMNNIADIYSNINLYNLDEAESKCISLKLNNLNIEDSLIIDFYYNYIIYLKGENDTSILLIENWMNNYVNIETDSIKIKLNQYFIYSIEYLSKSYFNKYDYDYSKIKISDFLNELRLDTDTLNNLLLKIDKLAEYDRLEKNRNQLIYNKISDFCTYVISKDTIPLHDICDTESSFFNETIQLIQNNLDNEINIQFNPLKYEINDGDNSASVHSWLKIIINGYVRKGYNVIELKKNNNRWILKDF